MRTLRRGSKGDDVKKLQRALHLVEDGIFGVLTVEAVLDFQRAHGLTADGVVGPATWAALGIADDSLVLISKRVINEIIVHCTATKEGVNYTVAQVRQMHLQRKFSDIGYHFLIYIDGTVHTGRPLDKAGAHCKGHNPHSIGVCYVGGLDRNGKAKDTRTDAQKTALLSLLKRLKKQYPKATIHGHREFAVKDCPCFDAKSEYKRL